MYTASKTGKIIGTLLLLQVAIGLFIHFDVMPQLLTKNAFITAGESLHVKVGLSSLSALVLSIFNVVIAALCWLTFKEKSPVITLTLFAMATAKLAVTAAEFSSVMELVSYGKHYLGVQSQETRLLLENMSATMKAGRNWSHIMGVVFSGSIVFTFYLLLFRSSTIHRAFTGIALVAVCSQLFAVTQPFFGGSVPTIMLAPIGILQFLLPIYFIIKGIEAKA